MNTRPPWYTIFNAAESDTGPAEVMLFGEIGNGWLDEGEGINVKDFVRDLDAIPRNKEITLRIHSPGGRIFDGLAIYHNLLQRRDRVTARVEGLAASTATFVAMAAKRVVMPRTARFMIHDAHGLAIGDSDDMREVAELLDRESDNVADIYAAKTGLSRADVRALMRATTWMNGDEAKAKGFVDEVTHAAARNCAFDLSIFRRVPSELSQQTTKTMNTNTTGAASAGDNATAPTNNATATSNASTAGAANTGSTATAGTSTDAASATAGTRPRIVSVNVAGQDPVMANADAASNVVLVNRVAELEQRLERDRRARIDARLNDIAANRDVNADEWRPRAYADETVLDSLLRLPTMAVEPRHPSIVSRGNPLLEDYGKMKPGFARNQFRIANHAELIRVSRQFQPRGVNTFDAKLVPDYLADAIIVAANNVLAPLALFSRNFGVAPLAPGSTVQVKKATVGDPVVTNPTTFESGNSTLAACSVTVAQINKGFTISNTERNNGFMLSDLAAKAADIFCNGISDIWTALLIAANYPAPLVIGVATAFVPAGLAPILAAAKNFRQRNLLLDGGHLAYLLPTNQQSFAFGQQGAFGFTTIDDQNRWTGAVANTAGFVASSDAVAVASGMPAELPAQNFESVDTVTIEQIGLSVLTCEWFSLVTRSNWASYDVMFGAGVGDASQGKILVTA